MSKSGLVSHPVWGIGITASLPPSPPTPNIVTLCGNTCTLDIDLSKGGAVVSLLFNGQELISNQSAGDQWQVPLHYYNGTRWSNPTQAGGQGWTNWYPSHLTDSWADRKCVEVRVAPAEWEREAWGGEVLWVEMELGHRIDLDFGGFGGLIRHEAIVNLPNAMPASEHGWLWSIAHTMPFLKVPWRLGPNLTKQTWRTVPPHDFQRCPEFGQVIQSAILASEDNAHALGVTAYTQFSHSDMSVHPRAGGTADCTRLGVARNRLPLPKGQSRYTSWWAVGDLSRVEWLLRQAIRFEQGGTICPPGHGLVK